MIDQDTQRDLERSFRAALSEADRATARARLLEAGWLDALSDDEPMAVQVLFSLQGSLLRDVGALDDVMLSYVGAELDLDQAAIAHLVPAPSGRHRWIVSSVGSVTQVVTGPSSGHPTPAVHAVGHGSLTRIDGIDAWLGLREFRADPDGSCAPLRAAENRRWEAAEQSGRRALAVQLAAGSRALLGLASAYATERQQFGRRIGRFQAVQHRLATVEVGLAAAEAAITASFRAPSSTSAIVAKALAGRAAALAGRHCLQVFGGIGFTAEHEFHRYFRRCLVLDQLLGSTAELERRLGSQLVSGEPPDRLVRLSTAPSHDPAASPA